MNMMKSKMFAQSICLTKKGDMKYKKIKSLEQYTDYCNIHESLVLKEDKQLEDEIELLEILIEEYDNRIMLNEFEELSPVELLRSLLRDNEMSQSELAKEIGISTQLVSDIMNYRRNMSKEVVIKLSRYFCMSQEAFSRRYELKSKAEQVSQ